MYFASNPMTHYTSIFLPTFVLPCTQPNHVVAPVTAVPISWNAAEGLGYADDGEEHLEVSEEEEDYADEEGGPEGEAGEGAEGAAKKPRMAMMTSTTNPIGQLTMNHYSGAMAREAVNIGGGGTKKGMNYTRICITRSHDTLVTASV